MSFLFFDFEFQAAFDSESADSVRNLVNSYFRERRFPVSPFLPDIVPFQLHGVSTGDIKDAFEQSRAQAVIVVLPPSDASRMKVKITRCIQQVWSIPAKMVKSDDHKICLFCSARGWNSIARYCSTSIHRL